MPGIPIPLLSYPNPSEYLSLHEQGMNLAHGGNMKSVAMGNSVRTDAIGNSGKTEAVEWD